MDNQLDNEILKEAMKDYINDRSFFNKSKIAEAINMDRTNFNSWLNDKRSLPAHKIKTLENCLKDYGFLK